MEKQPRNYKQRKRFWKKTISFLTMQNKNKHSYTYYKNVYILNILIIPFFWGKDIIDEYHLIDCVLKIDTPIKNGRLVTWYESEGYGHPCFDTYEDAQEFIDTDYQNIKESFYNQK